MDSIYAKSIINRSKNNYWFGTDYNMNIYRGCMHNCIYCDSRSECYQNDNFDIVFKKEKAISIIQRELRYKRKTGVISTGAMSDPYNKFEETELLTRKSLEEIFLNGFGVQIASKSALVSRDCDILKKISEFSPVMVGLTITTYDDILARKIERNVSSTSERFGAMKALSENGIYTGTLMMPILPFINDDDENVIKIVETTAKMGGKFVYPYFALTLRDRQRTYFYNYLDMDFKGIKEKYIKSFGNSYYCQSRRAKDLATVFRREAKKYGLKYQMKDIVSEYKKGFEQISFF